MLEWRQNQTNFQECRQSTKKLIGTEGKCHGIVGHEFSLCYSEHIVWNVLDVIQKQNLYLQKIKLELQRNVLKLIYEYDSVQFVCSKLNVDYWIESFINILVARSMPYYFALCVVSDWVFCCAGEHRVVRWKKWPPRSCHRRRSGFCAQCRACWEYRTPWRTDWLLSRTRRAPATTPGYAVHSVQCSN